MNEDYAAMWLVYIIAFGVPSILFAYYMWLKAIEYINKRRTKI